MENQREKIEKLLLRPVRMLSHPFANNSPRTTLSCPADVAHPTVTHFFLSEIAYQPGGAALVRRNAILLHLSGTFLRRLPQSLIVKRLKVHVARS